MDQDRPLAGCRDFQLAEEAFALHFVRSALVVVVEANFAAGDDFRLGEQAVELGQGRVVGLLRVVRIDAGAGVEPGQFGLSVELAADVERLVHLRGSSPMPMASTAPTPASHARESIASRSSA